MVKKTGFRKPFAPKGIDEESAEKFIGGAETHTDKTTKTAPPKKKKGTPWDDANDNIIKVVNLRLTESQHLKLTHIKNNTPLSIHQFIMSVLEPEIEKKIKEIG